MINIESVKFVLMLDTLSDLSTGGYKPCGSLKADDQPELCVYYDENSLLENKLLGEKMYRAVNIIEDEMGLNEDDFIYWDEYIDTDTEYFVYVVFDEINEEPYVKVYCKDLCLVISQGEMFQEIV